SGGARTRPLGRTKKSREFSKKVTSHVFLFYIPGEEQALCPYPPSLPTTRRAAKAVHAFRPPEAPRLARVTTRTWQTSWSGRQRCSPMLISLPGNRQSPPLVAPRRLSAEDRSGPSRGTGFLRMEGPQVPPRSVRGSGRRRGAAAAEFAILAPLLLF